MNYQISKGFVPKIHDEFAERFKKSLTFLVKHISSYLNAGDFWKYFLPSKEKKCKKKRFLRGVSNDANLTLKYRYSTWQLILIFLYCVYRRKKKTTCDVLCRVRLSRKGKEDAISEKRWNLLHPFFGLTRTKVAFWHKFVCHHNHTITGVYLKYRHILIKSISIRSSLRVHVNKIVLFI
jgi:hypothetical protein